MTDYGTQKAAMIEVHAITNHALVSQRNGEKITYQVCLRALSAMTNLLLGFKPADAIATLRMLEATEPEGEVLEAIRSFIEIKN